MRLHHRTRAVAQASADIGMKLNALQREHGLTDAEMLLAVFAWERGKWTRRSGPNATRRTRARLPMRSRPSTPVADYQAYLRSDAWKARRAKAFAAAKGTCLACGRRAECVHHRSYERLGQETDADLVALCWDCHQACHLNHVEHAEWGLWGATNATIKERRAMWGLPPVRLPRPRSVRRKRRPERERGPGQDPMASPVRVAMRSVPCPKCKAAVGELCSEGGVPRRGGVNHGRRVSAYEQERKTS